MKDLYLHILTLISLELNANHVENQDLPQTVEDPSQEDILNLFIYYTQINEDPRYIVWNTIMMSLLRNPENNDLCQYLLIMTSCAKHDIEYFNQMKKQYEEENL